MTNKEKAPYGYIYCATNQLNGKNYNGQTVTSRWGSGKDPIKERWKEEVREAYAKKRRGENLRHIENAIIKHGPESFNVKQQDVAYSQKELDIKERKWIKDLDSMNRNKGYNMNEGGLGGRPSQEVRDKLSNISSEKWQNDPAYIEKQLNARKELAQNQEFIDKMTKINQERARNPEWREKITKINREITQRTGYKEKMSKISKERQQDPEYRAKMSKTIKDKYQRDPEYSKKQTQERRERAKNPEWRGKMSEISKKNWKNPIYRQKQKDSHDKYKKKIENKKEFLEDIKNNISRKEMLAKYNIGKNSFNKRIQEMFGPNGPKNYTEMKNYLQDKDINDVLKEINAREAENKDKKLETKNDSGEIDSKTKEENNAEDKKVSEETDKDQLDGKEIPKDPRDESTEENQEEKAEDKEEKPGDDPKDESEKDSKEGQAPPDPEEDPKDQLADETKIQQEPRKEKDTDAPSNDALDKRMRDNRRDSPLSGYKIVAELVPTKIPKIPERLGIPTDPKDYSGVDQTKKDKGEDFKDIDKNIDKRDKDYNGMDDTPRGEGNDFDGIDKPQERGDRDYDNIDERPPEGKGESGSGP
jgi:hypothetical protein